MKVRKLPIEVEVVQFLGFDPETKKVMFSESPTPKWVEERFGKTILFFGSPNTLLLKTLEGKVDVKIGNWIIKGIEGEIYPCQDNIFLKTYQL